MSALSSDVKAQIKAEVIKVLRQTTTPAAVTAGGAVIDLTPLNNRIAANENRLAQMSAAGYTRVISKATTDVLIRPGPGPVIWVGPADPSPFWQDGDIVLQAVYTGPGGGGTTDPTLWRGMDPTAQVLAPDYTIPATQDMTGPAPGYSRVAIVGDLHVAGGAFVNGYDVTGDIVWDGANAWGQNLTSGGGHRRGTLSATDRTCTLQAFTALRVNPGNVGKTGVAVMFKDLRRGEIGGFLDEIHVSQVYQATRSHVHGMFIHSPSGVWDAGQSKTAGLVDGTYANAHCDGQQTDGGGPTSATNCGNIQNDYTSFHMWGFDATPSGTGQVPQQMQYHPETGRYLSPNYGKLVGGGSLRNAGRVNSAVQAGGNNPAVFPKDLTYDHCEFQGNMAWVLNFEVNASGTMAVTNNKFAAYQGSGYISRNGYGGLVVSGNTDLSGNPINP